MQAGSLKTLVFVLCLVHATLAYDFVRQYKGSSFFDEWCVLVCAPCSSQRWLMVYSFHRDFFGHWYVLECVSFNLLDSFAGRDNLTLDTFNAVLR